MQSWIFQGNPKRFDIDDYLSRYSEQIYWHTPILRNRISIGDRAYIWRAGSESGVVAIGEVTELPTPAHLVEYPECLADDLWRSEPPDPEDYKTGIGLSDVRLSSEEFMIRRGEISNDRRFSQSQLIRAGNASVFEVNREQDQLLQDLWHYRSSSTVPEVGTPEGKRTLVAHYRRERSSRLRKDKIDQALGEFGVLSCEICKVTSPQIELPFKNKMFEVHHRVPLSKASDKNRTTLADMAILCANCHRMVHATGDVEKNFEKLKSRFGS